MTYFVFCTDFGEIYMHYKKLEVRNPSHSFFPKSINHTILFHIKTAQIFIQKWALLNINTK